MAAGLIELDFLDGRAPLVVDPTLQFKDRRLARAREACSAAPSVAGQDLGDLFISRGIDDLAPWAQVFVQEPDGFRTIFTGRERKACLGADPTGTVIDEDGAGPWRRRIWSMLDLVVGTGQALREYLPQPIRMARGRGVHESVWVPLRDQAGRVAVVLWVSIATLSEIGLAAA